MLSAAEKPRIAICEPPPSKPVLAGGINESEEQVHLSELTIPGAVLVDQSGFMRGHGTYTDESKLHSSVAGRIEQVNKLISVRPVKCRYQGEVGDVVVGRIVEVQQRRWKVDTGSRLHSVLLLNSVNLPGGELRRKGIEDELAMREYLKEGDLVSAEVQQRHGDGALALHTRSLKYGKLGQGILVKVPPHLIKRRKGYICNLYGALGVSVIFGCNGWVWISRPISEQNDAQHGGYVEDTSFLPRDQREMMARVANCVGLLAANSLFLYDTSVTSAVKASANYEVKELIWPEVGDRVADEVRRQMKEQEER